MINSFNCTAKFALVLNMARLRGFEPPAYGLEVRSSIQLSYRRSSSKVTTFSHFRQDQILTSVIKDMGGWERSRGYIKSIYVSSL